MGILLILTKTTLEGTRIVLAQHQKPQQTRTEAASTDHYKGARISQQFHVCILTASFERLSNCRKDSGRAEEHSRGHRGTRT
jgi:hypothetical protein